MLRDFIYKTEAAGAPNEANGFGQTGGIEKADIYQDTVTKSFYICDTTTSGNNVSRWRKFTNNLVPKNAGDTGYTAQANEIVIWTTGAPVSQVLPATGIHPGDSITIKKGDATTDVITVTVTGGVINIDGAASYLISAAYQSDTFVWDGAQYYTFNNKQDRPNVKAKTFADTGYNAIVDDSLYVDASGGVTSIVLPTAVVGNKGRRIQIKKTDASVNAVNVTVTGGGNIDGAATDPVSSQYESHTYESDGAQWWLI